MSTAITAYELSKRYRIGAVRPRARTLKDALVSAAATPLRNLRQLRGLVVFDGADESHVVWALRDVSFELRHGEVLGVVGRNGAGKSTLLKILSRITRPTSGRARVHGRVASLLEVGTGFHPELTGRDNVFLNGSILGMSRAHMTRRFDAIVEFAGVERFIDTPVKRYSSGMYLRLAFAVAAHLEPDVLIVDEVLAVGDAEFQQRCLRKMDQVAREGRTVLFVSHNLGAVQRLCTRTLWLDRGRLACDGPTAEVVSRYLAGTVDGTPAAHWHDLSGAERSGSGLARFVAARYGDGSESAEYHPHPGGPFELRARIESTSDLPHVSLAFSIRDQFGTKLVNGDSEAIGFRMRLRRGLNEVLCRIPQLYLKAGRYQLDLWLAERLGPDYDWLQGALQVEIHEPARRRFETRLDPRHDGIVFCDCEMKDMAVSDDVPRGSASASESVPASGPSVA